MKRVAQPRGIFPSLPNGMDRVIKHYCDTFRAQRTLPPELRSKALQGIQLFEDQGRLNQWRDRYTGLVYEDTSSGAILRGAVDDLLVQDGRHIPLDYKTKGSVATAQYAVRYYQHQMDCYTLLLEENHLPTAGYAVLLYYSPQGVREGGSVLFETQAIRIETDAERARKTFRNATALLRGPMPDSSSQCEYCAWLTKMQAV